MKSFFQSATFFTLAFGQPFGMFDLGLPEQGKNQPAVQCPAGYNLVGKHCEQILTTPSQVVCATGALVDNVCATYAQTVKQCPLGTTPIGKDGCAAYTLRPAQANCPEGFTDAGSAGCVAAKNLPRVQVCEIGAMDASGVCILVETAPKITKTFCPAGFQDLGKGCESTVEYDCSPPPPLGKGAHVQAAPAFPSYPYKHKKRMLGAKKYAVYAPRPVAAIPVPPPSKASLPPPPPPPPAPKVAVVKQLCQRKDFAPPLTEAYCPSGFTEVGKKCVAKKTYPPVQKCANGAPIEDCVEKLSAPRLYLCNEGTLTGEQCQIQTMIPIQVTCPPGTHMVNDRCASFIEPMYMCPPGLQLQGNVCYGMNKVEPTGLITRPCTGKECWQNAHKQH